MSLLSRSTPNPLISLFAMIDFIGRILRGVAFAILALLGMMMALAFMFSTAIAVGVFYIIARLRGKPFGIRTYWNQRGQAYHFGTRSAKPKVADIIDVQVRDVH